MSARYAQRLGMDFLGMTGKFHTFWGEFGGYKHPNALRYETSLSLANGARCSIGDQLHPLGLMDEATYTLIGKAYSEVAEKEPWCENVKNVADVGLLSVEAAGIHTPETQAEYTSESDSGAVRILLEGNILFDVLDLEADFSNYKVLILPDGIQITPVLEAKLTPYLSAGGKILASGASGLRTDGQELALDLGVKRLGENQYRPSYFKPYFELESLGKSSFVMYGKGQNVERTESGTVLGDVENSYFNRDIFTFCSHQHSPSTLNSAGPGMVESSNGIYLAWNVFEDYATKGSLVLKEIVLYALKRMLSDEITVTTNLPAQGVTTLQHQEEHQRYVQHLLYASPVKRGNGVEIIEDIVPIYNVKAAVKVGSVDVKEVYLAPQMIKLPYKVSGNYVSYTVPSMECHQMIVIEY
ncbi:beta-galactosidase trimerization domain-containing protein [Paenibacillus swuensis]|uniref:beta-galactosidase trimerization domain-containing protein n=1 Tax=Paenibacillus swuensis TaxID=1178515 RepID=UPI000838DA2A